MDERQLTQFLAIAEEGSVTRAAVRLEIAQPSLSQTLLRLEDELGSKLFQRAARGVVLTEAGEIFRQHARKITVGMQLARDEIASESPVLASEVAVGLPSSFSTLIGARLIIEVAQEVRGCRLKLTEAMSGHIREWLTRGELDMGVLYNIQGCDHLSLEQIGVEELFVVGNADAFPNQGPIGQSAGALEIAEVTALPLILPSTQHGLRRFVDEKAKALAIRFDVKFEVDSLGLIKSLIKSGHGYSLLSHAAISEELRLGQVSAIRLAAPVFRRGIFLARNPAKFVTRASIRTAEIIAGISDDLIRNGNWIATSGNGFRPPPKACRIHPG